jgi:AcrR family transcriptional regulator
VTARLHIDESGAKGGLRHRKKVKRRDEIMFHAKALFAERGIDATTMAEIAEAAEVSPPTVFNYFGNKDGILIALIAEGTRKATENDVSMKPRDDSDFGSILIDAMVAVSEGTLNIAAKRVWRYAEAAAIRHPDTELAREFRHIDMRLRATLEAFLLHYDLRLRSGEPADTAYLADLIYNAWSVTFIELIKDEGQDLIAHERYLSDRLHPLVKMLFDDAFLNAPILKAKKG